MIAVLRARGEILPFERFLIPQYEQIKNEIAEALRDSGSILNKELNFIGGSESTILSKTENKEAQETLLRFQANDREIKRERRQQTYDKEREIKFQKKLEDWLIREEDFARARGKESEREAKKAEDIQTMINKDLNFDPVEEKK